MSPRAALVVVAIVVVAAVVLAALFAAGVGPFARSSSGGGPRYHVTFTETGLPPGATWSVTLGGAVQSASGQITFSEPNGSFQFSVASVQAYTPFPASGPVLVNGTPQSFSIFFTSGNPKPLGTAFAWGTPINATGTTTAGCPSSTGHYCYTIEIAGSAVSTSNVQLELRSATGAPASWPTGVSVSLFSPSVVTAVASYSTATNEWSLVAPFNGQIAGGFTVVIYTNGTGTSQGLVGDSLIADGADGYAGSVVSNAFA